MGLRYFRILFPLLLVLLSFQYLGAQQNTVWKRRVSRLVEMKTETGSAKIKGASHFVTEMVEAIKADRLTAYYNFDTWFSTPLTKESLNDMFYPEGRDITNSRNGDSAKNLADYNRIKNPDSIKFFRVLEEWSFDPAEKNLVIKIVGVAPATTILNEDGSYRAVKSLFWLHYADVKDLLVKYGRKYPDNSLILAIWRDYIRAADFDPSVIKDERNENIPAYSDQYQRAIDGMIDITEPEDTFSIHLLDCSSDTSLLEKLVQKVKSGGALAYSNTFHRDSILTLTEFNKLFIYNSANRCFSRDTFNFSEVNKYKLAQQWAFDPEKGEATVVQKAVAPIKDIYDENRSLRDCQPIFWVKFSDFNNILPEYEAYHSQHTIAKCIWEDIYRSQKHK